MLKKTDLLSEPHHQALEVLCVEALARGDLDAAFRLADRRCRIRPLPDAHSFVLRADALHRMGERDAAIADLKEALRIAPDDLATNRRLMAWGTKPQKAAAAKILIDCDDDPRVLRRAIVTLHQQGRSAVAKLHAGRDTIEGWAAWREPGSVRIRIHNRAGDVETCVENDAKHILANGSIKAASFSVPLAMTESTQLVSVMHGSEIIASLGLSHHLSDLATNRQPMKGKPISPNTVTVVVPVFANYEATKACLQSLADALGTADRRVLIVDDASPDPNVRKLVHDIAAHDQINLLSNESNLGFVGAVNRALREIESGDVILLNSDTVVPKDFIDKLETVARSSSNIATVTPLSNNGEFTSFPVPNKPNPILSLGEIEELNSLAAAVNPNKAVDIPNGIGFCLYMTRAAIDAVGLLSESYQRGYLEDVDFCLRARQRGFRNVCATGVYVGHAGSLSFGSEKRSLVVKNLRVIERKFPNYRTECAEFVGADPLKAARQAIELCLPRRHLQKSIVVSRAGAVADIAHRRATQIRKEGAVAVLLLEIDGDAERCVAKMTDTEANAPQSLEFELSSSRGLADLASYLRRANIQRIEFLDLASAPQSLLDVLVELNVPLDVTITSLPHAQHETSPLISQEPQLPKSCCLDKLRLGLSSKMRARVDRIFAPDEDAAYAASLMLPARAVIRLGCPQQRPVSAARLKSAASKFGIVPVRGTVDEHSLIRSVIDCLNDIRPELPVVIMGSTRDDLELMQSGRVFVTGRMEADELAIACQRHQLSQLFICLAEPLFGHPIPESVAKIGLPVAAFSWFGTSVDEEAADLSLDPRLPLASLAERLISWLGK